jgi:hypothetical protein
MNQITVTEHPHVNSNLYSGHYLDDRLQEPDQWYCDEAAQEAMTGLLSLSDPEGLLVDGYGGDALIGITSGDRGPRFSHRGVDRDQSWSIVTPRAGSEP